MHLAPIHLFANGFLVPLQGEITITKFSFRDKYRDRWLRLPSEIGQCLFHVIEG